MQGFFTIFLKFLWHKNGIKKVLFINGQIYANYFGG